MKYCRAHIAETIGAAGTRFIGIDAGAEALKLTEVLHGEDGWRVGRREIIEHGKKPASVLLEALHRFGWETAAGAAVTGRFSPQINLTRIPSKQAQLRGCRHLFAKIPITVINIGSHAFSVLEIRAEDSNVFRENGRCSQGTGNFLSQLVERFSLTVQEASSLCADVSDPAPLSGRCPVILKTDMTHLANKGENRARILAGLFDAVCENVLALIKPGVSPKRVLLIGGLCRSPRIRRVLGEQLARQGMEILPIGEEDSLCLEALGCGLLSAENPAQLPALEDLLLPPRELNLERIPSLADSLGKVRRMPTQSWAEVNGKPRRVILGFDIGSTGAKAVALDPATQEIVWEAYRQTLGDPVGAAQDLLRRFTSSTAAKCAVVAFGATGSGREIAGSLLAACYGRDSVFIVNEIVAHATGALHFDAQVDTIFEIGGQDAKYIRLAEGRIVDCAMNEACSAGTGSFIEEQGRKFAGIQDVQHLGQIALGAPGGISLGQHCSVFMAEIIDEAVAAGIEQSVIISGLYDSIVKNYLNRVKGNRSVGKVIFCQGMPFSAGALAAAVARQTGSQVVVPPNPGSVGALGIALLAVNKLDCARLSPLDPALFLEAKVSQKDVFVCGSIHGCGGTGNHCRIERLRTVVGDKSLIFTWGGGCSLHDNGVRKKKLPDLAPDPFRERGDLLQKLITRFDAPHNKPKVALSDEFMLKGLFPFFAAFFYTAGFGLEIVSNAGSDMLKCGIQEAHASFCAPMQLFHGVTGRMARTSAEWVFVPMLRSLPRPFGQRCSVVCPVVQAAPDLIRWTMTQSNNGNGKVHLEEPALVDRLKKPRLLAPLIDFNEGGLNSKQFLTSCRTMAQELGLKDNQWQQAWLAGVAIQKEFGDACRQIGQRALEFCRAQRSLPVIVLGRDYTIHNTVLNSNVPAILREQGVVGIPGDCFPLDEDTPMFSDMYWGYGHDILRAAHQVRRTPGIYALYCSNYSCGPDSFNLHFAAYVMEGKPFAVIETDGHTGDAGTKTRVEAFLHCVEEDYRATRKAAVMNDFGSVQFSSTRLCQVAPGSGSDERLLIPYIGQVTEVAASAFRGLGLNVETLPPPTEETLRLGRRYTSGKECLPMPLTLGSLIQRLEHVKNDEKFIYLMASTDGPCRFGVYNLLNRTVLDRLGWSDRVRIWSPKDTGYYDHMPAGTEILLYSGVVASDLLLQAKLDVRPVEREHGTTEKLYRHWRRKLIDHMEVAAQGDLSAKAALWQVFTGQMFGICKLLERAGAEFAAIRGSAELPVVELAGEIYVRAVEFSNDYLIEKLEARRLRVHLAPMSEWLNYCSHTRRQKPGRNHFSDGFSDFVQRRIQSAAFSAIAPYLDWAAPPTTAAALAAARPYVNAALEGEAVLTVGAPLYEWQRGKIHGVVNVGPLECMPTKIAEAQFHHMAERDGLINLTLSFNGEPSNTSALDNFAFEVHARFRKQSLMRRGAANDS
jgi:activator of 2-hydroxyglutaryl-CoA dehydratase/predicted nucleotide-binding protein (sugar kinase/HSP70/actin superfamily)